MTKSILIALMLTLATSNVFAESKGGGGANGDANAKLALQRLILDESYNLKASLRNYINTIVAGQVSDPVVKSTLIRIGKGPLLDDIDRTRYRIADGANEAWIPALGTQSGVRMRPAATTDFASSADVSFDLDLLFSEVKNLPQEDQMIAVASLAIHEQIHHFQTRPATQAEIIERESEAYEFSGYLLATAKFAQVPLLKWTHASSLPGDRSTESLDTLPVESVFTLTEDVYIKAGSVSSVQTTQIDANKHIEIRISLNQPPVPNFEAYNQDQRIDLSSSKTFKVASINNWNDMETLITLTSKKGHAVYLVIASDYSNPSIGDMQKSLAQIGASLKLAPTTVVTP